MAVHDYIRQRFFPHMWCPGCGHGIVLNALLHAVDGMGLDKKDLVMVSGIGCSARISGYVDFHSLHTLHGRALAFATGLKLSKPELRVIVPWATAMPWPSAATISSMPPGATST